MLRGSRFHLKYFDTQVRFHGEPISMTKFIILAETWIYVKGWMCRVRVHRVAASRKLALPLLPGLLMVWAKPDQPSMQNASRSHSKDLESLKDSNSHCQKCSIPALSTRVTDYWDVAGTFLVHKNHIGNYSTVSPSASFPYTVLRCGGGAGCVL